MTPQAAYEKRYAPMTWNDAAPGVKDLWLAAWTISSVIAENDEREACAKLCMEIKQSQPLSNRVGWEHGTVDCAAAIRARGETK